MDVEQIKQVFPDCTVQEVDGKLVIECKAYRFVLNTDKTWKYIIQNVKGLPRASDVVGRLVKLDKRISRYVGSVVYQGHSTTLVAS